MSVIHAGDDDAAARKQQQYRGALPAQQQQQQMQTSRPPGPSSAPSSRGPSPARALPSCGQGHPLQKEAASESSRCKVGLAPLEAAASAAQHTATACTPCDSIAWAGCRVWLLSGRIYNYPKPGAMMHPSHEAAHAAMQAEREVILGLGRVGLSPSTVICCAAVLSWCPCQRIALGSAFARHAWMGTK